MSPTEYEAIDRQVERKLKGGDWVTFGWAQMHNVADDKVAAGSVEKRWNDERKTIEYRSL